MKNTIMVLGFVGVFGLGLFFGVKIIDNNQSVYMDVDLGVIGNVTIGKQLNLTNLDSFHEDDKVLLISGIKKLSPDDVIASEILELAKKGVGLFTPQHYNVKLHITNDLQDGIAAICEDRGADFYRKTVAIFDNSENSITPNMVTVAAWDTRSSGLCFEDVHHIWVGFDTAQLLFPAESNELKVGNDIDLYARVSNTYKQKN